MMVPPDKLRALLQRRHLGEAVIARIMRLNPEGLPEGARIRGWNPGFTVKRASLLSDFVSKGALIRNRSRAAWEYIRARHPSYIRKHGRRAMVPIEVIQDWAWADSAIRTDLVHSQNKRSFW